MGIEYASVNDVAKRQRLEDMEMCIWRRMETSAQQ